MIGGLAIGAADDVEQLRLGNIGLGGVAGNENGGADAFAVEAEILGAREGQQRFRDR
ncbi:hypothetical protein D3C87_2161260 [compost metagenome]